MKEIKVGKYIYPIGEMLVVAAIGVVLAIVAVVAVVNGLS